MRGLFDMDGPLMNGLGKITDCILLSLCWISLSLPIVTMGAASGALYRTVYRCIRHDEGNMLKGFWETFRKNLKAGILVWLPILAVYAFLIADAAILRVLVGEGRPVTQLLGVVLVLIGVATVWAAYCTAYCVRFEGSLKEVLWLNFFLVLSHPLMTIMIMLFLVLGTAMVLMVPYLALFLPAAICLAISFPMESVFMKHMRPEDIERVQNGE